MQELEKILEEIKEAAIFMQTMSGYGAMCVSTGAVERIIRKHMSGKDADVSTNDLISRQALLDDFRNTITENSDTFDWLNMIARQPTVNKGDGWIPVEERMPEAPEMEDEYPEFNVMIEGAKIPTTLQYSYDGVWIDDYGNVYNVIAWRPLPESYIPRNQNKPEDHYPDWRAKLLNKFDRRE